jgi:hypothetical protein
VLALCTSGCAAAFQPQFKPEVAPRPEAAAKPILTPKPRDERPVAVGVTQDPMRLCAWDLSAGLLWERPVVAKSAPLVVGTAIVMQEANGVVVRDLATGDVRAVADEEGHLVGADAQGGDVVIAVAYDTANPRGAVILVSGDSVRWRQPLNLPVGTPAISNGLVVVPWATQRLSVLASGDGKELARFHFKSTVIGHAVVDRGHLYIGQLGLLPVTEAVLQHPEDKYTPYTPKKRELPGQPPLLPDGYFAVPEPDNAHHRLQLDWRIASDASGAPVTENGMLWLRFYRLLFGLDAQTDAVRWVHTFEHDVVGFAIVPGGVILADDAGVLRALDTAGNERMQRDLGRKLRVITLRPGVYLPSAEAAATNAAAPADPKQLRTQLYAAAALDDDRLSAGRAYAIEHMAGDPAPDVTTNLIALCAKQKSPEPVRLAACGKLAERDNGGNDVIEALRQHASFLEGTPAPPIGALAQAAAKMQLVKAGPLIVSHVEDPNTPASDLPAAFLALEKLSQRNAVPAIERFVRLHHAEPSGSELAPAVIAALHALGGLKAKAQRPTLEQVAQDGFSAQPVRDAALAAIAALDADNAPKPQQVAAKEEPEEEDEVQTDPRPYSLGADVVKKTLAPLRKDLSSCLVKDPSKPYSGRLMMVIDGTGKVEGIFVTPSTLSPCVEPIARRAQFPATRLGRQRVTQLIYGPNASKGVRGAAAGVTPPKEKKAAAAAKAPAAAAAKPAAPAKPASPAKPAAAAAKAKAKP